jgi:hypothetical protein
MQQVPPHVKEKTILCLKECSTRVAYCIRTTWADRQTGATRQVQHPTSSQSGLIREPQGRRPPKGKSYARHAGTGSPVRPVFPVGVRDSSPGDGAGASSPPRARRELARNPIRQSTWHRGDWPYQRRGTNKQRSLSFSFYFRKSLNNP